MNGAKSPNHIATVGVPLILVVSIGLVRAYLFGSGPPTWGARPAAWLTPWYAFLGGIAVSGMSITVPILSAALATTLWAPAASWRRGNGPTLRSTLVRAVTFGVGFAVAFSTPVSGTPAAYAALISAGGRGLDVAGGVLLAGLGIWSLAPAGLPRRQGAGGRVMWPAGLNPASVSALAGALMGLLLFHKLDPMYDSVFFSIGLVAAESHWPRAAYAFSLGLASGYVVGIAWLGWWAERVRGPGRVVIAIQRIAALAAMLLGIVFAIGLDGRILRILESGPPDWTTR